MYTSTHGHSMCVSIGGHLVGVGSFLPPYGTGDSDSDCRAWRQVRCPGSHLVSPATFALFALMSVDTPESRVCVSGFPGMAVSTCPLSYLLHPPHCETIRLSAQGVSICSAASSQPWRGFTSHGQGHLPRVQLREGALQCLPTELLCNPRSDRRW